jgi:hypothetical protein
LRAGAGSGSGVGSTVGFGRGVRGVAGRVVEAGAGTVAPDAVPEPVPHKSKSMAHELRQTWVCGRGVGLSGAGAGRGG